MQKRYDNGDYELNAEYDLEKMKLVAVGRYAREKRLGGKKIPSLTEIRVFAQELHVAGEMWQGEAFGWPAEYQPEINLVSTEIEEYAEHGVVHAVIGPFWSPAAFMLGESGIWFYSLSWDEGADKEPMEFIDRRNVVED